MSEHHRVLRNFLSDEELNSVLAEVSRHEGLLHRTRGAVSLGPRYAVIGGDVIAQSCPRIAELGRRLIPVIEEFGGCPVTAFSDQVRSMRIQRYEAREDGFRWHFDGHPFAAVVTLENLSGGVTEFLSRPLSALLRPLFYASYPFPYLFSSAPSQSVHGEAGDALLLRGSRILHRGKSMTSGRRTILVFSFDHPGKRPSRFRNWFARLVNY